MIIIIIKRIYYAPFPPHGGSKRFTMTDHKLDGGGEGGGGRMDNRIIGDDDVYNA